MGRSALLLGAAAITALTTLFIVVALAVPEWIKTSQTQSSNVGSITINLKMGLWRYCYEFVVNGLSTTDGFACTTIDAACEFEIAGTKSKLSDCSQFQAVRAFTILGFLAGAFTVALYVFIVCSSVRRGEKPVIMAAVWNLITAFLILIAMSVWVKETKDGPDDSRGSSFWLIAFTWPLLLGAMALAFVSRKSEIDTNTDTYSHSAAPYQPMHV